MKIGSPQNSIQIYSLDEQRTILNQALTLLDKVWIQSGQRLLLNDIYQNLIALMNSVQGELQMQSQMERTVPPPPKNVTNGTNAETPSPDA